MFKIKWGEKMFREPKICVNLNRKRVVCVVRDETNVPYYERLEDFNIENIMSGDVLTFYNEKDFKDYLSSNKDVDPNDLELITYREMLNILLKQVD